MTAERVWSVQWVRFVCPGCDEEVHLTNCGTNQVLICERCQTWGVRGHLAMKRLGLDLKPTRALRSKTNDAGGVDA